MKITGTILASYVPSLALALVGDDWRFDNAPADGLNDITFPINIANAPHQTGFYFAQQYEFEGVKDGSYCGLQPREDKNGQSIIHGVFSAFENGTTSSHPNCHNGADGGPGVSCAVDIVGDYSHTYNIYIENAGGTTWRGILIDTETDQGTVIGEYTLPAGSGKILNGDGGFVEYYPWNGEDGHPCDTLPRTEVTFGDPSSQTEGAFGGRITSVYEYADKEMDCVGRVGFSTSETSLGQNIQVGF
ncbi:hypothetical protein HIM_10522 [Hirsutella minnesotensis 3608]|uniref:Ubiquitin 3 binding protein But2 C-terminal domain-containing protein n=1 Tax=Hirsutella minnesotensis 3608 TaxID=1043627 RepID=A0A0F7ZX45_9HYPO|nr:hypothetical protein HIM_10522 [Hirsutella minnesotensis 3608]